MSGSNAQFTSAGKSLTVIGSKCYAYSGSYTSSTTSDTKLLFATGKQVIDGEFQLNMPVDDDSPNLANRSSANIKFNGITVSIVSGNSADAGTNRSVRQRLIVPPLTEVEVIVDSDGNEGDRYGTLTFVGDIIG